uniref:Uncharacterized protein n=1 Tax=Candidatus Kentrum sp. FW TaxID=2126338 RepID=A0A450TIU3_9GAMM|nr:MAG: hypothetical protein BECKFW1821C_GA0114237_101149 [Candidatus Kentron sp. FW]
MTALFTNYDPDFASFLAGTASLDNDHWPLARNFLLDERVSRGRAECYGKHGAIAGHESITAWRRCHEVYLEKEIFVRGDGEEPPRRINAQDPDICPETFRYPMAFSSLGGTSGSHLIRVEKISDLMDTLNQSFEDVLAWTMGALAKKPDPLQNLDVLLRQFAFQRDCRPAFAGIWEDLSDLFGETPDEDPSHWADALRDRLGLYHYDPKQSSTADPDKPGPIGILVFRYPVEVVPCLSGLDDGMRPLAVPCVLDGDFSPAFFPSPRESDTGHAMDLADIRPCDKLTREVLHPAMRLQAEHLFRVGSITRPVNPNVIQDRRSFHLICLQERFDRSEYGQHTDRDLL